MNCPSTYSIDTGDYAEPLECDLPIEHNADDDPWHSCSYETDGERVHVEWHWDKDWLISHWPRPTDPMTEAMRAFYEKMTIDRILKPFPLDVKVGSTVSFRKWAPIENHQSGRGDAD